VSTLRQQIGRLEHDLRLAERHARIMDKAYISTMDPDCIKAALIAIWPNAVIPDLDREVALFISTLAAKVQEKVRASGVQAPVAEAQPGEEGRK
jgi:hypothetical protein